MAKAKKSRKISAKLNARQKKFVREYSKDRNATQAAKRAGYSERTAKSQGQRLLTNVDIKQLLELTEAEDAKRNEIDKDDIIQLLQTWAYSDITETLELSPSQIKKLPIAVRRLITHYKHTTRTIGKNGELYEEFIELKFVSKEKAVELLNRMLGFNAPDEIKHSGEMKVKQQQIVLPEGQTTNDLKEEIQELVNGQD